MFAYMNLDEEKKIEISPKQGKLEIISLGENKRNRGNYSMNCMKITVINLLEYSKTIFANLQIG